MINEYSWFLYDWDVVLVQVTSCNMGKCSVSGFINMVVRRDTILKDKCEGDVSFNMGLPAITNNARIALHVDVETVQLP